MKRTIPTAALVVMPNAGHAINLEEPAAFNRHIAEFLHAVDVGAWRNRDPRAMAGTIGGGVFCLCCFGLLRWVVYFLGVS